MRYPRPVAMAITAVSLASAFQIVEPPKSPYERRGLHHATIRGRVVSPAGQPIPGVHMQLNAGRPRALPLASVVTGPDGRFTISNVNAISTPYLYWLPADEWLHGSIPIVGESAEE